MVVIVFILHRSIDHNHHNYEVTEMITRAEACLIYMLTAIFDLINSKHIQSMGQCEQVFAPK